MVYLLIVLLSFLAGLCVRWRLMVVVGPLAAIVYGVARVHSEPPNYDMRDIWSTIGAITAAFALVGWLVGYWIRNLPPRENRDASTVAAPAPAADDHSTDP